MTDKNSDAQAILKAAMGAWSGAEEMMGAPGSDTKLKAAAEFHNVAALGGRGMTSAYEQSVEGAPTMQCQTTYRLDDDGRALMTWTPASGEAQVFTGTFSGGVIKVARSDEHGMTHVIESDYSAPDVARVRSTISGEEIPEMEVFSGTYKRT